MSRPIRQALVAGMALAALAGVVLVGSAGAASPPPAGGVYTSVAPTRVLDTRQSSALGHNESRPVSIPGLPAGTTAVVLNVTVTAPTAPGYLLVYPTQTNRPDPASTVNFAAGQTVANSVTVGVSATGSVSLFNFGMSTQAVVDLEGFFTPAPVPVVSTVKIPASAAPINLAAVGGPIATGKTDVASVKVPAGTWNVNALATFFRTAGTSAAVTPQTYGTMVLWVDTNNDGVFDWQSGEGLATIGGVLIPKMDVATGDIDPTANLSTTITLSQDSLVRLSVFAYDSDRSSAGVGDFSASVQSGMFERVNAG